MRNNRKIQFMSCFVALTLIITNLFNLNVNAETQVKRLAGQGRYETAKVVTSQWDKSEYAVLVTGADCPDALSATPLAKKGAPIILSPSGNINNAVKKYLEQVSKTYVRNINVINKFVDNKENVYVATGANYPDALAGSALAAKNNSCILLVEELNLNIRCI
ncbi:hypothetical protein UT300018_14840 [Clostridium faecium]|uniref:Cell wall-binding repeat-containing protein n=2 Tax=Clostridiaceae TaxID=31979 RepID=A0ABR8YNE4_9CLOT|nr:cell wall-binding repeat-containing protein [Clostridium faecium]